MELIDYLKMYPDTSTSDRIKKHSFPKLANQVMGTPVMNTTVWDRLWLYDLIVCDIELYDKNAVIYNNIVGSDYLGRFGKIRQANPNAVILGYFSVGDVKPTPGSAMSFTNIFNSGFKNEWYMKDVAGGIIKLFFLPAPTNQWTSMQNPTTDVNKYIPELIKNIVLPSGMMDGVFYDWLNSKMAFINHRNPPPPAPGDQLADINNDGVAESDADLNAAWLNGLTTLLNNTRMMLPNNFLIMGNIGYGYDTSDYKNLVNGVEIEKFQIPGTPSWSQQMRNYYNYQNFGPKPKISFLLATDDNASNFTYHRFSLASALMFDGYYCFTNRGGYLSSRWADEFSVNISTGLGAERVDFKGWMGQPLGKAYNFYNNQETLESVLNLNNTLAETKIFRRDFENAVVIINPTPSDVVLNLNGTYRKIRGTLDTTFNDGSTITQLTLTARSGAVLLYPN